MRRYQSVGLDRRPSGIAAYRVLHLLPSAPQELMVEVYRHVEHQLQAAARDDPSQRTRLDELHEAYAAVADAGVEAESEGLARLPEANGESPAGVPRTGALLPGLRRRSTARSLPRRSPWELLHLDPDAPSDIVELAYGFWHVRLRGQRDGPGWAAALRSGALQAWRSAAAVRVSVGGWARVAVSAGRERLLTVFDRGASGALQGVPFDASELARKDVRAPQDLAEAGSHRSAEERLAALAAASVEPPDPQLVGVHTPRSVEGSEPLAYLVAESGPAQGVSAVIGPRPFRIGSDPTCDIGVTANKGRRNGVEARIWLHRDRFLFHSVGLTPGVLLNAAAVVWAVLEDGDRLQIGGDVFRFERVPRSGEGD